jgi:hypothetical protein
MKSLKSIPTMSEAVMEAVADAWRSYTFIDFTFDYLANSISSGSVTF